MSGRSTRGWAWVVLAAVIVAPVAAQETSLTVYADGRVVVRRALPVVVPRGTSTLAVDLGVRQLEVGSLAVLDSGVELRGARVVEATGLEGSLQRAVGGEVEFAVGPDSARHYVRGTLLSANPPVVRLDGRVRYAFPGLPVFPDSLVQLTPRVELTVDAARPQNVLRLMYQSAGLRWSAAYGVVVPRNGPAVVTGAATLVNPGAVSFRGARVQLLAGEVRGPGARPQLDVAALTVRARERAEEPAEEAVGGTHLYTLPGLVDVVAGEVRTVALFPRASASVEREYTLPATGIVGPMQQPPREVHPQIGYRVRRPAASPFGAIPLPAGVARVYEPDSEGRPQLVGEARTDHVAPGSDLLVVTGTAFDVTATRAQTAFERRGDREFVMSYRVELRNAGPEPVTVRVMERSPGQLEVLSTSVPAERVAAGSVAFAVPTPPGGEAVLEYRVRVRW